MILAATGFTALMVPVLVWSEAGAPHMRRPVKMLASTGFIAVAVSAGALDTAYGRWVLLGLTCCWLGDLLLTFDSRAHFLAGLTAFLLAHVIYGLAFTVRGIAAVGVLLSIAPLFAAGAAVFRWLRPHLEPALRAPVLAYVVVISLMVAAAFGTVAHDPDWRIAAGASFFYVSDVAVARNRFVAPEFTNRAWGLPLYYAGQMLLALSAA